MKTSRSRRRTAIRGGLLALILVALIGIGHATLFAPRAAHAAVSGFVTRSGAQLQLGGNAFRFSGANMEWLGGHAFVDGTSFEVDDALTTLQEMGGTVARSLWLTSLGTHDSLQPTLGNYNAAAFQKVDYAIKRAGDFGIRLIIPLVDGQANGDGSYANYTQWRNISDSSQFFTNSTVIGDYESFISTYLNHVNTYTGVAYKDDPTILAWETGNEIAPPQSWTQTIADYIKSIDANHLVAAGTQNGVDSGGLNVNSVDIEDEHFYPMDVTNLTNDAATVSAAGKVYIAGEYDWSNYTGGSSLTNFLAAIESHTQIAGDLFWELFPHLDTYGYGQYAAGDFGQAVGFHYPGDTTDMRSRAQQLRTHAFTMAGTTIPSHAVPGAPVVDQVAGQKVYWRGAANTDSYSVERATAGSDGPWTSICDRCVNDTSVPYTDSTQPTGTQIWYRVLPYSLDGVAGTYSQPLQAQGDAIVSNNNFEAPALGDGNFQMTPTGASWSFTGSSGISANNSAYTNGNANAPEGTQVAVLQQTGSFSIAVTLPTNTNECMTFFAAQRGNYNNGGEDFAVRFDDGSVVGTFKPGSSQYGLFATDTIKVSTSGHTLYFVGIDSSGGDNTAFIDNVRIVPCS